MAAWLVDKADRARYFHAMTPNKYYLKELAVQTAVGVRFRAGDVENARNTGEFAGPIITRKHES